jgi:hypothetical protein
MILSFDVVPDAIEEHDDWHTHEHLPERLAIPGFLRGTRWVAALGHPRYFVLYEVEALATLTSAAYLERLNHPTPWTAKMMPHYRGMTRGFCTVTGSFGAGLGQTALLIRFKPAEETGTLLREWLLKELPRLPSISGLGSAHLFEAAAAPPSTSEQRIRGADSAMDWAVLVTGYRAERVADVVDHALSGDEFRRRGAAEYSATCYEMGYSLAHRELSPQ